MDIRESSKQLELSSITEKHSSQIRDQSIKNENSNSNISQNIMKQYWTIFIVVFFVSSTPIALSSLVWEAYKILFPTANYQSSTFIVDYWVIIGIICIDSFVLLLLLPTLKPFKEFLITKYIKNQTPPMELEKEAYRKFVRLPNLLIGPYPIAIATLEYTTIKNANDGLVLIGPV